MQPKHWTAFILLGGIWSASFLWIKLALNEIGPTRTGMVTYIFPLGGVILGVTF
jgi:hypothetical protein